MHGSAPDLWEQALRKAERITDSDKRVQVLVALAGAWDRSFGYSYFAQVLDTMGTSHRKDWLAMVKALLPIIAALGETTVMREVADAILDTARWWP
jgi:hypothetical protein